MTLLNLKNTVRDEAIYNRNAHKGKIKLIKGNITIQIRSFVTKLL